MMKHINRTFDRPEPGAEQADRMESLRTKAKSLALAIDDCCPVSAEKAVALRRLRECLFWAGEAILRDAGLLWTGEGGGKA